MVSHTLKIFVSLACLLSALGIGGSPSRAATNLEVESRVTWATIAQPELHLLLRNHSDRSVKISVGFGSEVQCSGDPQSGSPSYEQLTAESEFHAPLTFGVVPSNSWLHRSFPLSLLGRYAPPCVVDVEIWSYDPYRREFRETIRVEKQAAEQFLMAGDPQDSPPPASISADALVERVDGPNGLLVLRTKIEDPRRERRQLRILDRQISCPEGTEAKWSPIVKVFPGEDVGPVSLDESGWHVFISVIESAGDATDSCVVTQTVESISPSGSRSTLETRATLEGDGLLSRSPLSVSENAKSQ